MTLDRVLDALGRAPSAQDLASRLPGRGAALRLSGLPGSSGAAASMGKNVTQRQLEIFILGSVLMGIGGAILVTFGQIYDPGAFQPINHTFLIWVMIIPMLLKVDFGALQQVRQHWRGIGVTLFVNWAVKPFSMALLGWIFLFATTDLRVILFGVGMLVLGGIAFLIWSWRTARWPFPSLEGAAT